LEDLFLRAAQAIEREESVAVDAVEDRLQMFDNVKHTRWCREVVARQIASDVAKYRHLDGTF
jgi:hypothetical protein